MVKTLARRTAALALVVGLVTLLAACGGNGSTAGTTPGADGPSGSPAAADALDVVASFYPLQYAVERVGGDAVRVTNLTKPGAEPHDLELSPRDVASLSEADVVVYLSGFQPAVDDAVSSQAADAGFDVASKARLDLEGTEDEHGHEGEEHAEEEGHAEEEEHAEEHGTDPHFWLDPTRLADVGDAIAERLAQASPANAATFTANAAALRTDLTALDGEFEAGLVQCTNKNLVTSHQAFGYLAQRYGLTQVGITGLSPEAEPDAATIADVTDFVRANKVTTIYYETLVSPAVAQTVASETGAKTAVLDPLEGISDASAAQDYLGVMRANLAALRAGQPCP